MPFEPAPQPEVQTFQKFADAILRGCRMRPIKCEGSFFADGAACALGAMALGLGYKFAEGDPEREYLDPEFDVEDYLPDNVCHAYLVHYGATIPDDNDKRGFTREQIAARIAAL